MKAWRQRSNQQRLRNDLIAAAQKLPDEKRREQVLHTVRTMRMGRRVQAEVSKVLPFASFLLQQLMLRAGVWPQAVEVVQ